MNKLLQAVFESSVEGILVAGQKNKILVTNPACAKMFGYTTGEMEGMELEMLMPYNSRKQHTQHVEKYAAAPEPRKMGKGLDLSGIRRDGSVFPVEISLSPTEIEGQKAVIAFIFDITERKKIEVSNNDFARIIEESLNEIHIFDAKSSNFILMNGMARKSLGYTMEEFRQMTPADILYNYNLKDHKKMLQPLIKGEIKELQVEAQHQRKDGTSYPVETFLQHITFGGRPAIQALILDITARKKAENDLQQGLQLFRTLTELAPIGIFLIDSKGECLFVNKKWEESTGISLEESLGLGWVKAIHPEDTELFLQHWNKIRSGQGTLNTEYRFVHKETKLVTEVWTIAAPVFNDNNQIINYVGINQDITALKKAKQSLLELNSELEQKVADQTHKLRESEEKLETAQRISKIGYWVWKNGMITLSHESRRILGVSENEIFDLEFVSGITHPDDRAILKKYQKASLAGLNPRPTVFRVLLNNGKEKSIYVENRKPKRDKSGKVKEIFGIIQDVTVQKKIEQKLAIALEREKDLSELKSRFVSMASHEFRTPLGVIMTAADLIALQNDPGKEEKRLKNVGRIRSNIKNLTILLNDFLSLEKLESGKMNVHPVTFNFANQVDETIEELQAFKQGNQKVVFSHQGTMEVHLDEHLIKSILINLISNAIKYSPQGQDIDIHSNNADGLLRIAIKDRGLGIPKAEHKDMFTRFFRATNVDYIKGTGIGLTIVKRYLELMGGHIEFDSEENQGTTFRIAIPIS